MDLQKPVGTAQFYPGAEKVPNWKTVQCGTSEARWKRQQPAHDCCQENRPGGIEHPQADCRRNRLIMQTTKNRKFPPVGNSLLYISLLSVALIASFTSSAILNNLFAICNSRLLPTNQIVNCDGRVRPQGRTLFLFCI